MSVALGSTPAVETRAIDKRYGGVVALDAANLVVAPGSIHGIVGENGAGKSTLMKVLAGVVVPDAGQVLLKGHEVHIRSPLEAEALGVGIVYQELSLFPSRSVLANLFANHEITRFGVLDIRAMSAKATAALAKVGLDTDPGVRVEQLTLADRQRVELSRALLRSAQLLILDEPNSALSASETDRLFALLRALAARGVTILYVSHRLEEVFEICSAITVLRNGSDVLTASIASVTTDDVAAAMVGHTEGQRFPPAQTAPSPERRLVAEHLSVAGSLDDVSLVARAGEVVGLAGLEGSGTRVLLETLFGLRRATHGTAAFPDGGGLPGSATEAARRGIAFVPADRRVQGLMLDRSVAFNIAHVMAGTLRGSAVLPPALLSATARRQIDALGIVTSSEWATVNSLSGGNQQKVVLAKWMAAEPQVLLLDDPTRGVDVGAKHEIYRLIRVWSDQGRIIVMTSSELPELAGLCDRTYVIFRGRVTGELAHGSFDTRALLRAINTGSIGAT
jgi:ribose transport system ATP-binding protein